MLKVKICGITNLEDALLAESLGADMLGFVFYPKSPRRLSFSRAEKIIDRLSPFTRRVGVFVNLPAEKVLKVAGRLKLDFVQLAGDEGSTDVKKIQKELPVIKAFRVGPNFLLSNLLNSPAAVRLVDSKAEGLYGGSGKTFDWGKLSRLRGNARLMLAGGLSAENLVQAYETLRPAAVDLTSSLEARPGRKDSLKMKKFFEVANEIRIGR